MTSPAITAAAASTRTEADVRACHLVITQHKNCPFCGADPGYAVLRAGWYLVGCESDECPINPQAGGKTRDEAWAKWDAQVVAVEIERLRKDLAEQDDFILKFTQTDRNGDWACAQCKPHSDMIEKGFTCGYHRAVVRASVAKMTGVA